MCSTLTPDCRYGNSTFELFGNVYRPGEMCCEKKCVHKKTFHSPEGSDYQFFECKSTCQVSEIPFEQKTSSCFLKCDQGLYINEETQKPFQENFGDAY